jgi:hypothetical protein
MTNYPISNAYTHAPHQYPNLYIGTLQLISWLFFHPTAWRNHIARIEPSLRPDFTLAELTRAQWRNRALLRLFLQGYIVWPLNMGLCIGVLLLLLGMSPEIVLTNCVGAVIVGGIFGLMLGVTVGVAVGMASVIAFGLIITSSTELFVVTGGLAGGMVGGLVGNIHRTLRVRRPSVSPSWARQLSSIILGALLGTLFFGVTLSIPSLLPTLSADFYLTLAVVPAVYVALAITWHTGSMRRGIAVGLLMGVLSEICVALIGFAVKGYAIDVSGIAQDVLIILIFIAFFAPSYLLTERVAGSWAGAAAGTLGVAGGIAFFMVVSFLPTLTAGQSGNWQLMVLVLSGGLLIMLIGLALPLWLSAVLYPFMSLANFLLMRSDERRIRQGQTLLFRYHPAFWDEHQRLHWINLDEHLVMVSEYKPTEGQAAFDYLATSRQRWAAQAAQIELDARRLEQCATVVAIANAYRTLGAGELSGPISALLRSLSRISQDSEAALKQESSYNQRLALSAVEDRLDGLVRELTRSAEPYAVRFRPIAARWRELVAQHTHELAETVEQRQEIDSPYVIGVPLTDQQEIFVGRTDISARIEQLLLDRRRPPLLLYGQRRMGKTSLLNNLGRLLPSTIIPLFVDLQGPASLAKDHAGFLHNLARGMSDSAMKQRDLALPSLTRERLVDDPFTRFDEWLDHVERELGERTALLTLDEFEALDNAISEGRFNESAVLGMLRHIIQHRTRFKVLLSGSHTLDELQRWASYLINVQVVQVSYLKSDEARQLVEQPVKGFALRYEAEASARVLRLTRGHPFLVQLLCAEIVALKNEHAPAVRRLSRVADVEAAVPDALSHGSFFFADIQRNQVNAEGLALLQQLARQGEDAITTPTRLQQWLADDAQRVQLLNALMRRELIEKIDGGYRFQVELVRRWFEQV